MRKVPVVAPVHVLVVPTAIEEPEAGLKVKTPLLLTTLQVRAAPE
jgi:hypothetical protein